ncbi:serine/threonine protein kinase [Streptomyces sp. NBC_00536]|uniref:serine/threonine-protein kinase n=1 Tax=Streptomyces sp. NBC_00536 TaxID=2975769 RepID=UPI002E81019F|nr:serine/threonine-protein kinase [Streptomyces sp. NBC_00536]WUC76954.1 serine/threonine protein kinase [Streptomyces sp. NBC_00536]
MATTAAAMADWEPGALLLKEFTVERILGEGGFGRVALVRNLRSGEPYAVKRLHSLDPVHQGNLLTEAQRWIALPPHPHITECRFTRSVGDRLAVFSAYAPGGSLDDRIRSGELFGSGGAPALRRVLAIAAQAAWGLETAHAAGLLHLDVKPANILFGADGAAMITDFGLADVPEQDTERVLSEEAVLDHLAADPSLDAREREAFKGVLGRALGFGGAPADDLFVAAARGRTTAYASPEQAEGRQVGPSADVWSWAVTVLEMLVGERTWMSGTVAALALETACRERLTDRSLPVPPRLAGLLRECFRDDPSARPGSLGQVADVLLDIAREETGGPLEVGAPPRLAPGSERPRLYERRSVHGAEWADPRGLLHYAYETAALDLREAVAFWPRRAGGLQSRLLEDLRTLNEAWRVLSGLSASPSAGAPAQGAEIAAALARCAWSVAEVQQQLGDVAASIDHYRQALRILDALPPATTRTTLPPVLISLSIALRRGGAEPESLVVADRAIAAARLLEDPQEGATALGSALLTKANTLERTEGAAEALYEASAAAFRSAGDASGEAKALAGLAALMDTQGRPERAAGLWDEVDRTLSAYSGAFRRDLQATRASIRLNRAQLSPARSPEQLSRATAAVDLYGPLVREQGLHEFAGELGTALCLVGIGTEHRGDPRAALAAYQEASELLQDAVLRDGRAELAHQLAESYDHASTLIRDLDGPRRAVEPARRAVDMWRRLTGLDGIARWGGGLAAALEKLAVSLLEADLLDEAEQRIDDGLQVVADPGWNERWCVAEAMLHRTRGVVYRRGGRLGEAHRACARALEILEGAEGHDAARARLYATQTIAAVLGDAGEYREALRAHEVIAAQTQELVREQVLPVADLADAFQRLANSFTAYGLPAAAADAARASLEAYDLSIGQGRSDLVAEAARTRGTLAIALQRSGALRGALEALEEALDAYRGVPEGDESMRRAARVVPGRAASRGTSGDGTGAATTPEATPGERAFVLRGFGALAAELRETLGSRPADLPRRLSELRERYESAVAGSRAGSPREASMLLEGLAGTLTWLAAAHQDDRIDQLSAETGLAQGMAAMYCGREAAADHGFRQAVDSYHLLVMERRRPEFTESWFKAWIGMASSLVLQGDDAAADETVRELIAHVRRLLPREVRQWNRLAESALREMRQARG